MFEIIYKVFRKKHKRKSLNSTYIPILWNLNQFSLYLYCFSAIPANALRFLWTQLSAYISVWLHSSRDFPINNNHLRITHVLLYLPKNVVRRTVHFIERRYVWTIQKLPNTYLWSHSLTDRPYQALWIYTFLFRLFGAWFMDTNQFEWNVLLW